jgi:fructose/tagatose bisphosphate aldolase
MFDGSSLPLEENLARTNHVAALAHAAGCLVEAELGTIGGVEDDHGGGSAECFSAEQLNDFCRRVEADLIAPAIGNAHGFYSDTSQVRLDLLPLAQKSLRPTQSLVLHGGTGLSLPALQQAVQAGVVKINISTHLKQHTRELIMQALSQQPLFDEAAINAALIEGLAKFYAGYMQPLSK